MITFPAVLFRHPDTRGLPGSSCLNEEPWAQWTESLFHNQLTTIPHVWCQWTALSILGNWLTQVQIQQAAGLPWVMVFWWNAWENQGEAVWKGSSSTCPSSYLITFPLWSWNHQKACKGYSKNLYWEWKITKDMNTATLVLTYLKSLYQNRPQHRWGEQTLRK